MGTWRRVGYDQKHKALWLKPLYWFHNFPLRLFLRTGSSPLENSDVTKCVAVEYPCSRPDLGLFLSRGFLALKQSTRSQNAGPGSTPQHSKHRADCGNYKSNLIINTALFQCRTQRWRSWHSIKNGISEQGENTNRNKDECWEINRER
jgi:hypothetical protein